MKILMVSTIRHNPGDDFIRFGQQWLLGRVWPHAQFRVVHKHDPRTLFGSSRRCRTPHRLLAPILYRVHAARGCGEDLLGNAAVVVFAGSPFIWRQNTRLLPSTSANAEWICSTWEKLFDSLTDVPVLNLAAGTSLNADQGAHDVLRDKRLTTFLDRAVHRTQLTTARDRLTSSILGALGHEVDVLPCTSFWAAAGAGMEARPPEYVAVNVMPRAVHAARGKPVASRRWKETIREVVRVLSKSHPIRFMCHSPGERRLAQRWFPEHDAFYSEDERLLLDAYSRSLYTVSNRVHAAGATASFGRPAVGIGGDSRIGLLEELGLPTIRSERATAEHILGTCRHIEAEYDTLIRNLHRLATDQQSRYVEALRAVPLP